jgi:hypothetical protein
MTTTAIRKTVNPLAALPWQVTLTAHLKPGDLFTTDAGYGVLVFVERTRRMDTFAPVTAIDLTGKWHRDIQAGRRVHKLLDADTLPTCDTCEDGCECATGSPGCEHFACWGTGTDADTTCPGALAPRIRIYQSIARRFV